MRSIKNEMRGEESRMREERIAKFLVAKCENKV
jgi:hypothetical protein